MHIAVQVVSLLFATAFALTSDERLSLHEKDSTYSYHGVVSTGTNSPNDIHSLWEIFATIQIKGGQQETLVKISDVKLKSFKGKIGDESNIPPEVPKDIDLLTETFSITHNHGLIKNINLKPNEDVWSANIKRGIASLLQLDMKRLDEGTFYSQENNLYGTCLVQYRTTNSSQNELKVHKSIDHAKCENSPKERWSTSTMMFCPNSHLDSMILNTERVYVLDNSKEGVFVIKRIEATNVYYEQHFEATGDVFFSKTKQVLELLDDNGAITTPGALKAYDLRFEIGDYDLINGRSKISSTDKIKSVKLDIESIMESLEEDHILKDPKILHNSKLNMLHIKLRKFDLSELHQIFSDIGLGTSYRQETSYNIFLELLPQIGTEASADFIKELILSHNIKDVAAMKLLMSLPFYMEFSSDALLERFEPLFNLKKVLNVYVRQTAVLSFATLVFKTRMAGKCSQETFDKYARQYFDLFTESKTYEDRMLYLQGLNNLQLGSVMQYLTPVISNSTMYDHHIRFLAVWASMPLAYHNPSVIYQTYWPILEDRTEHLEMRVAAMTMLIISEPTSTRLLSLFWFIKAENNPHLYNYFYTTVKSLQYTTYPCYINLGKVASQIIRLLKPPNEMYWTSGNYLMDYKDRKREFGSMMQLVLVGNPRTHQTNVFYLTVNNYANGDTVNQFGIYLKLEGLAQNLVDELERGTSTLKELVDILKNKGMEISPVPVHVEIIVQLEGKAIISQYVDSKSYKKLFHVFDMLSRTWSGDFHMNHQHVSLASISKKIVPSDIGTPILYGELSGVLGSLRGNVSMLPGELLDFDIDFRYSFHTHQTYLSYNPLSDLFYGIEREKVVHGSLPFITKLTPTVIKVQKLNNTTPTGLVFHSQISTFIRSIYDENVDKKFSKNDIKKDENAINKDLVDIKFEDTGRQFKVSIFECDPKNKLDKILSNIHTSHQANYDMIPFFQPLLLFYHTYDYVTYVPPVGECGLMVTLDSEPSILENTIDGFGLGVIIVQFNTTHRTIADGPILNTILTTIAIGNLDPNNRNIHTLLFNQTSTNHKNFKLCSRTDFTSTGLINKLLKHQLTTTLLEPTFIVGNISWGTSDKERDCSELEYDLQWNYTSKYSSEQMKHYETSDIWPFNECKDDMKGLSHMPVSDSCIAMSMEMLEFRYHNLTVKYTKIPAWLSSSLTRVKSASSLFSVTPNIAYNNLLNIQVETSMTDMTKISVDDNVFRIKYKPLTSFSYKLFKMLKLLKVSHQCKITKTYVKTMQNNKNYINIRDGTIALADCSYHPIFGLIVNEDMSFTLFNKDDKLTLVKEDNKVNIYVNGKLQKFEKDFPYLYEGGFLSTNEVENNILSIEFQEFKLMYFADDIYIDFLRVSTGHYCGICA